MNQSAYGPRCTIASEHLQIEETGSEVIVFDTERRSFHFLNPTAYSIFKACNGFNSIRDIAAMICEQFHCDDVNSVIDDVTETIAGFRDKGLVTYVVDDPQLQQSAAEPSTESPLLAVSVTGSSMFPVLLSGDKVLVKKSAIEELAAGDIIVWSHDSLQRIAHRALSIEASSTPPLITTKGDLCLDPDPPVEFDRVLGKIVAVIREGNVRWIKELDKQNGSSPNNVEANSQKIDRPVNAEHPKRKPSYERMMVLDLRDISVESILNIESVEQISLVLLSPENAHAWSGVPARDVKAVLTAPKGHRVYTGQPELLPEMLEFLGAPLRLVVSGQLFLTAFEPEQISEAFDELILNGQAYVSSAEAKAALESVANILSGEICVVPAEHARWIGQSILGPEYLSNSPLQPLVAVGELTVSTRVKDIPDGTPLFNLNGAKR
jgi:signal peptidase I